jgi:pre-rRNA-processing protein TSR1
MERFLRPGEFMVATCYAPIAYPQLPVLVFKAADPESPFGPGRRPRLAATGSLHSCNPDRSVAPEAVTGAPPLMSSPDSPKLPDLPCFLERIANKISIAATALISRVVVKKIVLTGFPIRVHKKKAVIKYMFHNPEDVKWFKVR